MPPKPRKIGKPTPPLLKLTTHYVAKNKNLKDIKGQIPDELFEAIKEKKLKQLYNRHTKERSSQLSNKRRKTEKEFKEDYKIKRSNALEDPDIRSRLEKELK